MPRQCTTCGEELPDLDHSFPFAESEATMLQCGNCRARVEQATLPAASPISSVCVQCGQPLSQDAERHGLGGMVCTACLTTLRQTLSRLVEGRTQRGERPPQNLAGYTVLEELGHGGMGAVYKVQHPQTGAVQALKVLLPQREADALATAQFLREIENTKALHHPHVVCLHETGCAGGLFFFTLEYCEGGTIRQLQKQRHGERLPLDEACCLILQALSGLDYAHERGLVHRDIKPANLFLSGSGPTQSVKLGDYGLAKAFDLAGLSGLTRTGTVAGTPYYMPRQQVINFRYVQPAVDVWAMAATLYHLLTGTVPREFGPSQDPWWVVLTKPAVPIRQRNRDIPERLAEVIDDALQETPQIGIQTVREFQQALEREGVW